MSKTYKMMTKKTKMRNGSSSFSSFSNSKKQSDRMHKSQKTEKDPASSQEDMLKRDAIKWAQCSTEASQDMLLHVTASILYQVYVARSSAHEDLHIINDGG